MYYLVADPRSGAVVRRSRRYPTLAEQHLSALPVPKHIWKTYRAGDLVNIADIESQAALRDWLAQRRKRPTCGGSGSEW